tara:strand:- start:52310 stop:53044 length:735 start_codon:yes stop_codon:yes gene_type:complete
MIISWLGFNSPTNKNNNSTNLKHYILGTSLTQTNSDNEESIILGCGCFWGAEKGFWRLPGVILTAVGYAGGKNENPSYQQVCSGSTGHAEVVKVVWNKNTIDLSDILKLFWECHDPTQGNRQGNDIGSQYRSAIFTQNENQKKLAISSKNTYQDQLSKNGFGLITTEIKNDLIFYFAENYHQQYLAKPGSRPYCSAMPTKIRLNKFKDSNFKLNQEVWSNYDWAEKHCILRGNNEQIELNKQAK